MSSRDAGVRPAAVAGSWYPAEPEVLRADVEAMLRAVAAPVSTATPAALRALVVPHAGLAWSGPTAAAGWARVQSHDFDRVVILAPSHRTPLRGAAVDPSTHYDTPLGRIAVDFEAVQQLAHTASFSMDSSPFVREHAIEMQLPFLQVRLREPRLVPVLVGELRGDEFAAVASAIDPLLDARTLLVVSSDFTHYGAAFGYVPFTDRVPERIEAQDRDAVQTIVDGDANGFHALLSRTGATICGRRPLGVLLELVHPEWQGALWAYTTSGAMSGDWERSVSYASIGFEALAPMLRLTPDEKRTLLQAARQALAALFAPPPLAERLAPLPLSPPLQTRAGVFVTLHRRRDRRLRGCIGSLTPKHALLDAVTENAQAAAQRDPRFDPLRADEVADLEIEISVLGAVVPVGDPSEIVIGRDGLVITSGLQRGVLLPQVASEQRWSPEEFLDQTCRKAGVEPDAWRRPGTIVERFAAEIFSESSLGI